MPHINLHKFNYCKTLFFHINTWLFLLILLSNSHLSFADNDQSLNKEQATQQQLEQLSREMKELNKLLDEFRSHRTKLESGLEKSEVDIGKIENKIRKIQQRLNKQQDELGKLKQKRKNLQAAKQKQQKFIEKQVLSAYQIGKQKKLKVLLNQEQPDKVSRALTYYDYFNQARSEQIENYIDVISELDLIEPKITKKTLSLSNIKKSLNQEHKNLLLGKKERKSNLSKINSLIRSKDQRLRKIEKDRKRLEQLLAAVEQTLTNIKIPGSYQPFTQLKGKLPWPVGGKPNNKFGKKRNGVGLPWQGLTISAQEGTNVKAIHHGRVVFADWFRGSGLLIIIDHGDGYMSLYAHNQSLLKEMGEWVVAGENISTVGNSGGQKQANLYFEIRHNGKPTNPLRWCKKV